MSESEILPAEADVPPRAGGLPVEAIALVRAYQRASKAEATVRAYSSDWREFQGWCARTGFPSAPASPEAVAAFLVAEAEAGRSASTIGRRCAAISYAHKLAKEPDPTDDEEVRATMKGIRRRIGVAPKRKAAATAEIVAAMLMRIPDTMTGKRDRALLALGFARAFRRSELVALDVADLVEHTDGLRVTVRRSKTDQEGQGARRPSRTAASSDRWRCCGNGWRRRGSPRGRCSAQCRGQGTCAPWVRMRKWEPNHERPASRPRPLRTPSSDTPRRPGSTPRCSVRTR